MNAIANRVALVTGAGRGLGRHLALQLAHAGASVAAVDLNPDGLATLEAELCGRPIATAVADVTDAITLEKAAAGLAERLGPIDLLIANAGIGIRTSALEFRAADIEAQIRVNLIGVANSIQAVLPGMLARGRGQLVAISSLASFRGLAQMAGYCASKAGVNAMLDGLRMELRPKGLHVTTICPGWIRTPLTEPLGMPLPFLMEPDVAARLILDAIRRRKDFYAFPARPAWRLRLVRWLPCAWGDRLAAWELARLERGLAARTPSR